VIGEAGPVQAEGEWPAQRVSPEDGCPAVFPRVEVVRGHQERPANLFLVPRRPVQVPETESPRWCDVADAGAAAWYPATYEVREQGPAWAVARESTPRSPFWVVDRYDRSEPAAIRWTIVESSYGGGGEGIVRVAPQGDGGSRMHVERFFTEPRRQKVMLFLFGCLPMNRVISRMWVSALDRDALSRDG
jgi:hypothetical protein